MCNNTCYTKKKGQHLANKKNQCAYVSIGSCSTNAKCSWESIFFKNSPPVYVFVDKDNGDDGACAGGSDDSDGGGDDKTREGEPTLEAIQDEEEGEEEEEEEEKEEGEEEDAD